MAAHSTDSAWFTRFCPNTNETDAWYKVYEEMYHTAYDTAQLTPVETIMDAADEFTNDIIPTGIMNYSYYTLKPEAMETGDYFDFDLVNDILTDKNPRPGWPYLMDEDHAIFMGAPLLGNTHSANPTYLISPDFFYKDDFNASNFYDNNVLKIDFDDGAGWIDFDPTLTTSHPVTYNDPQPTLHVIKVKLVDRAGSKIFGSSQSNIWVNNTINALPDATLDVPGLNVSVFNNCNGSAGKTVIYLEGIDVLDFKPSKNRTANDIYSSMIQSNQLVELKNQGYRFVVVDWKNSRVDMRFNALYLVNLIQELKNAATNDEQFIIMGESMGGIIARYALTYMESSGAPVKNQELYVYQLNAMSNSTGTLATGSTDSTGYFKIPYGTGNPIESIELRLGGGNYGVTKLPAYPLQDIDNLNVYHNSTCNIIVRLNVINSYTNLDTLEIGDFRTFTNTKFAGPFTNGIFYLVTNFNMLLPSYNGTYSYVTKEMGHHINGETWIINPFELKTCATNEVVVTIE